jgi:hypothetical protein
MRKIIALFVLLTLSSFIFGQSLSFNLQEKSDFEKLTFEVKLNKPICLPFEPLFVKFKVSNKTDKPIVAEQPRFLLHSTIKVITPDSETIETGNLSLNSGGGPNLPGAKFELQSYQSYEEKNVLAIDPKIFAKSGNYKLQFFLSGLKSNIVEVEIVSPQGINKEAFEFISEHGKDIWFGKILQEKNGSSLLKTFVEQYSESDYGEYAITSLGKYYLFFEKDLDKAEAEFEKIKFSKNEMITKEANKLLADIAKRKVDLQNLEKQKKKPQ